MLSCCLSCSVFRWFITCCAHSPPISSRAPGRSGCQYDTQAWWQERFAWDGVSWQAGSTQKDCLMSLLHRCVTSLATSPASLIHSLQPILVSQRTADPALTLISGIASSSDDYFRHFAYAELKQLAMDDTPAASARRTALFGDQKYNPSLWSCLAREGLMLLGTDYQLFLRRGAPAPSGMFHSLTPNSFSE